MKHFIDIIDLTRGEIETIINKARELKAQIKGGELEIPALRGKIMACIYEKPSTRTRISFEVAMRRLGGQCFYLSGGEMQFGRGETIADTAHILSLMVDAVMIRTDSHQKIVELCENATIPVINGLTDDTHPCQALAGALMLQEEFGTLKGLKLTWIGDGNNVANSWIHAAMRLGMEMTVSCPEAYQPLMAMKQARDEQVNIRYESDPLQAAAGADVLICDTWVSMQHTDRPKRLRDFQNYQVNDAVMKAASKRAIFTHCLPAHRGEEVATSVIDGAQSRIWVEAENRVYAQMAILLYVFGINYE